MLLERGLPVAWPSAKGQDRHGRRGRMANLIETFALVVAALAGKIGHSASLAP
jgi:hypothetical protein